jgi:GT2 family glycosyltransferase
MMEQTPTVTITPGHVSTREVSGYRQPRASIIVVSTNELHHLRDCMPSLARQSYREFEILLVDNGSTDGGPEYVERDFPSVRVLRNGANLGYVGANNRGFAEAVGEYLVVLNPDTEVAPNWLGELIRTMDRHPEAGMATSRICHFGRRDLINTCGNDVHITGLAFCRGLDEPVEAFDEPARVAAVSGCSFIIRRSVLEDVGGFDRDFFIYLEDTDLSIRVNLAGYEIRYVPGSIVYHKYLLKLGPQKFFFLERNRLVLLAKNFRWSTLAALCMALLLSEAMTWTYAALHGREYVLAKWRTYAWLFRNWSGVLQRRAAVQRRRRIGDRELLRLLAWRFPLGQLMGRRPARLLEGVSQVIFRFSSKLASLVAS